MVAQFLLAREISGQDSALGQLRSQIAELTQLLALEKIRQGRCRSRRSPRFRMILPPRNRKTRASRPCSTGESDEGHVRRHRPSPVSRRHLDKEKQISADALAKVELLNQQIAAMRRQLSQLNAILSDSEARNVQSEAADRRSRQAAQFGAWPRRSRNSPRYRSEFFGRLRQILAPAFRHPGGGRPLRVPVGSAVLQGPGGAQPRGSSRKC